MKKRTPRQIRSTAYHEAGHAVAYHDFGLGFSKVTIVPTTEYLGCVFSTKPPKWFQPEYDDSPRVRSRLEAMIVSYYAGVEAGKLVLGVYNHRGAAGDYDELVDLATYFVGSSDELQAYMHWLSVKTKNWVNKLSVKPCIEAVADALLEHKTLTSKQVREIIQCTRVRMVPPIHTEE